MYSSIDECWVRMRQAAWRSPWKGPHEITVISRSCYMPLGASYLPVEMSPLQWILASVGQEDHWKCGVWSQLFEYENEGINGPSSLGPWDVNLYLVPVAKGTLSLCHLLAVWAHLKHLRLPWVSTRAFYTAHPIKMCGRRRSEGRRRMRRRDSWGRKCRAGNGAIQSNEQATEPHAQKVSGTPPVLPGQEKLLWVMISPACETHAK